MTQAENHQWSASPAIEWLLEKGRLLPDIGEIVFQLGQRLHQEGAPVQRLRLSMRTLHPLIAAYSTIWEHGLEEPQSLNAPHGLENRPGYVGSPLEIIGRTGEPYRKNLTQELSSEDHSVLHEFKERGATDYYGIPLNFRDNLGGIFVILCDAPTGFSDHDLKELRKVGSVLAPIGELFNTRKTARAVADSYLGTRSGKLVLDGRITRGHVEPIRAATMISDIRNWTGLSNRLSAEDALALVNNYFELLSASIEQHSGEILKFVGDGILAVFPVIDETTTPQQACTHALAAARDAFAGADQLREHNGAEFGIGMHFGDVLYGNIGSETRLDFTVLGQTVNRTARIEGLCVELQTPLLFSSEFNSHLSEATREITKRKLKGFGGIYEIYTAPIEV